MKRIARYFFQGLLFVAPIGVTVYVVYQLFAFIDEPARAVLTEVFNVNIPGVGFVLTVLLAAPALTLIGFFSSNLLTSGLMQVLDEQFDRFPVIKLLHSSLKSLFSAFVGKHKAFNRPVLVSAIPSSDLRFIGFVTRATMEDWGLAEHVAVYIPAAFNFGGNLVVVPKERVQPLDIPTSEIMAFVFSGGIAGERKPVAAPPAAAPAAQ